MTTGTYNISPDDILCEQDHDSWAEETLLWDKSPQCRPERVVIPPMGKTPVDRFALTAVYPDSVNTVIQAPSVQSETLRKYMCGKIRDSLQRTTLAHIAARRSGHTRQRVVLEHRIAYLRGELARWDRRAWSNRSSTVEAPRALPGVWARLMGALGFGKGKGK